MKKAYRNVLLLAVALSVISYGSISFAAPSVAGTWKGTIMKVNSTACASVAVKMALIQCSTSSNLVRGTFTVGTTSVPITGKFLSDGVTLTISGGSSTSTADAYLNVDAKYIVGTAPKIQITEMDFSVYNNTTDVSSDDLYDTCILTK